MNRIATPPAPIRRAVPVQEATSPGGIGFWLVENYSVPVVALEFSFEGGATQDPAGLDGATTMMAGLLDEGAGPYDSQDFQRELDSKAIEMSFSADRDHVGGRLRTLARECGRAFELLGLALHAARFDSEPVERVRQQAMAGLRHEANDPDAVAGRAWRALAYPGHAYGRERQGTLESLPKVGRADVMALRDALFSRDGLKLSVVGAIDALRAGRLVDAAFGPLPARGKLVAIPPTGPAGIGERRVVDVDVPSSTIRFGRPGVGRHDPDFTAAMVIAHILGGGVFSARLFKEVREKRGLAYSISASLSAGAAAAALYGGTSTKNDRAKESLDVISSEIAALGAEGPSAEELANAQAYLVGSYPLHFDTSTKIAAQLLQIQRDGFGAGWLTERNAKIEALTLPEAKRVAGRLLGDGGLAVAIAGRPEGFGSIKTTETP